MRNYRAFACTMDTTVLKTVSGRIKYVVPKHNQISHMRSADIIGKNYHYQQLLQLTLD